MITYKILDEGNAIECLKCGKISHNSNDVTNLWCGHCKRYHVEYMTDGEFIDAMNNLNDYYAAEQKKMMEEIATGVSKIIKDIIKQKNES